MIRLSSLTALDIKKIDIARDLDASPKLYAYRSTRNNRTDTLLVQEDTSPLQQMTRNNALSSFWDNTLLGTANFYPEQGLGLVDFHNQSELHVMTNEVTLPVVEYKKAILYFSQGFVGDSSIKGNHIRLFCKLPNGSEVTLASVADFLNDSNIVAQPPKFFESQVWNEGLEIEFIDVEYLLNSSVPEIVALRQFLFGNYRPTQIFIEYSAFSEEAIDSYTTNGYSFTRLNFAITNQQSFPVTFQDSDMQVKLSTVSNGYGIQSQLIHQKFNIESYLAGLKEPEQRYQVSHEFQITSYDTNDQLISVDDLIVQRGSSNTFDEVVIRPLVDITTDHFEVTSSVRVENIETGLIFRSESTIIITNALVKNFKPEATIQLSGLTSDSISNQVTRQVNQIVQSAEVPSILTIEKKIYVQAQQLNVLELLDANFTAKIVTSIDISGQSKLYLQIDNLTIESSEEDALTFSIPKLAYLTASKKYTLLDSKYQAISTGNIQKI